MAASGERIDTPRGSRLLSPTSGLIDVGRMAIGQDRLAVSPMQMAMVASAVADGGILMAPQFVTKVVNPDGQTVQNVQPTVYSHVMRPAIARELAQMMTDVVEEGTGRRPTSRGWRSAGGKTGTAQIGMRRLGPDPPWFIGFAPVGPQDRRRRRELPLGGYGGQCRADRRPGDQDADRGGAMTETDIGTIVDGRYRVISRAWARLGWPMCSSPRTSSSAATSR